MVDFLIRVVDHVYAVDGITMEFERGKAYGLVGESGCGKSTTGKSIIGLEKITSGKIIYEGEERNEYIAVIVIQHITVISK